MSLKLLKPKETNLIVTVRSRGRHASRDHVLQVEELREGASVESLKLLKPEELKEIMAIDLWEVRVNRSWTLGESTPSKINRRGVETPEGQSPEVD